MAALLATGLADWYLRWRTRIEQTGWVVALSTI